MAAPRERKRQLCRLAPGGVTSLEIPVEILTGRNMLEMEHEALHQTGRNSCLPRSTILLDPGSSFSPRRAAATNMCPPLIIGSQLQTTCLSYQIRKPISTAVTPKSTSNQSTYLETRTGEAYLAIFSMKDCFRELP